MQSPPADDSRELLAALQSRLEEGWAAFTQSPYCSRLRDFAADLERVHGLLDKHGQFIPHPAHEYAAREMGRPFMEELVRRGLYLDPWFPGEFKESVEYDEEPGVFPAVHLQPGQSIVTRRFRVALYPSGGNDRRFLLIEFPHLHGGFGFPAPPTVRFLPDAGSPEV